MGGQMRAIAVIAIALALLGAPAAHSLAGEFHQAAAEGDLETVRSLLADDPGLLDSRNARNETALHGAAMGGHADLVAFFLDSGIPVDIGDNEGSTALDCVAIYGYPDLARSLIERGADINHSDDLGMAPLHFACYNGNAAIAALLLERGADVHATNRNGATPLHGAAFGGHVGCATLLLEHGAEVNKRTVGGFTPVLSGIAGSAGVEMTELLVQHGADIHDRQLQGDGALHYAVRTGKLDLAQYLIDSGVNPNAVNNVGWTVLHVAGESGQTESVQFALDTGIDINAYDSYGRPPLWWSAVRGNENVGALLLENGADPNLVAPGIAPALMQAVDRGHSALARLLVESGADVNALDANSGQTCLHHTAMRGWRPLTEVLLDHGADYSIRDDRDVTALGYAGRYGHRDVAELLTSRGADATGVVENYGRCALLDREVEDGQAAMWYLGHCGWAIKTSDHFLIFDYWNGDGEDPTHPCIANGHIAPDELDGERVCVFVTHDHPDHYDTVINGWADAFDNITYVFGFHPELTPGYRGAEYDGPAYRFVGPRKSDSFDGMEIRTISANDAGVGFLVEVDGLTLFHAGDHAGWADGERDGFFAEIDHLDTLVDGLDVAFLNVTGCHAHDPERLMEGNIYTLETLTPTVLVPTHASGREYVYRDVADDFAERGVTAAVCLPDYRGDNFFYNGESIE